MGTAPQTALPFESLPRTRVCGQDFAPSRQAYVFYIPAILALAGILSWLLGDEPAMVIASVASTVVAVYTVWEILFRKAPIRFSTLMGMALLLGYGMGTLNTWATFTRGPLSLAEALGENQGVLSRGLGAVLLSAALLYFGGELFEKPILGRDFRFHVNPRTRTLIYLGTLAMLAGYATHAMTLTGTYSSGGHVSISGLFLSWFYPPLTAVAVAAFLTSQLGRQKILLGLSALVLVLMFSVTGRRATIYTSMEILLMLAFTGYQWRGRIFRKILLLLVLGAVMVASALTFMLFRITASYSPGKQVTMGKRIQTVGKFAQKGNAYAVAAKATQENFQTRTFVLGFFANILDASSRMTPALGNDAIDQFQIAIPRVLYPGKTADFAEEGLVDQQFGFSYGDEANSVLTAGATDFGFMGVIFYPLLLVALFRIIYELVVSLLSPTPHMFVALSFIFIMLQAEMTLTGYFVDLRSAILFGIMLAIFMKLPSINLAGASGGA